MILAQARFEYACHLLGRTIVHLSCETIDDVLLIALEGQINGSNAADVEQNLRAQVDKGARRIALDFSRVDYISSAGLRVVLFLAKQLSGNAGALALYGLQKNVFEIFEMCGFIEILTVVDSREAALAKVRQATAR
jgi:stage II sporulation protein AA (anti-sigma F factor antagonist)